MYEKLEKLCSVLSRCNCLERYVCNPGCNSCLVLADNCYRLTFNEFDQVVFIDGTYNEKYKNKIENLGFKVF